MEDSSFWTVTIISTSLACRCVHHCLYCCHGSPAVLQGILTYRLVLYTLVTLTITSLCTMIKYLMSIINVDLWENNITIQDNETDYSTALFITSYAVQSGVLTALLLIILV